MSAPLRTSRVAAEAGVHPNTVRVYETWGFLQPVPRGPNGYRLYTRAHVEQMKLARLALHGGWPGRAIRRSALSLVRQAAAGDAKGAFESARKHIGLVRAERARAEEAAAYLEEWSRGGGAAPSGKAFAISKAAGRLELTVDTLYSWERNGLIRTPRRPNGYRVYGPAEMGRLRVIRMLYLAGYSTMAILRFMSKLDRGGKRRAHARTILDTPRPDEDVYSASDRWLTELADQERRARAIVGILKKILRQPRG